MRTKNKEQRQKTKVSSIELCYITPNPPIPNPFPQRGKGILLSCDLINKCEEKTPSLWKVGQGKLWNLKPKTWNLQPET
jgi:hypothetical protein